MRLPRAAALVLVMLGVTPMLAGCFDCGDRATGARWNQIEVWEAFPEEGTYGDYKVTRSRGVDGGPDGARASHQNPGAVDARLEHFVFNANSRGDVSITFSGGRDVADSVIMTEIDQMVAVLGLPPLEGLPETFRWGTTGC